MALLLGLHTCAVTSLSRAFPSQSASAALSALARDALLLEEDGKDLIDVYGEGAWLQSFEDEVAEVLGKEKALFVPTGVCAQMMALAVHCDLPAERARREIAPPSFIMHHTSHLKLYEQDNYKELLQLRAMIEGAPDRPLCADDVRSTLQRLASVGTVPGCIICEVPSRELGCTALPWDDLVALSELAKEFNCVLHCDGARLLEVAPYYGKSPAEVAALFDSVYISFYKGLCAQPRLEPAAAAATTPSRKFTPLSFHQLL